MTDLAAPQPTAWGTPQPAKKSGPNVVLIVVLAIVGLVVVLGGIAGGIAAVSSGSSSNQVQPAPNLVAPAAPSTTPSAPQAQAPSSSQPDVSTTLASEVKTQLQQTFDKDGNGEQVKAVTCTHASGQYYDCYSTNTTADGSPDPASARYLASPDGSFSYAGPTNGSNQSGSNS